MMNSEENSKQNKIKNWYTNSFTFKAIIIVFLMLLLMVPTSMIETIIYERKNMNQSATEEVSQQWAGRQKIKGPILTIPYDEVVDDEELTTIRKYFHILPETLFIQGEVIPRELYRGIYKVAVYESQLSIKGSFILPQKEWPDNTKIYEDEAFFTWGISDLRGIQDEINMNCNGQNLQVSPGSQINTLVQSGISVPLDQNQTLLAQFKEGLDLKFDMKINLQGSRNLSFVPLGSTTKVSLRSDWNSPKFQGNFLPDHREVTDQGFVADWKVLQLNRSFPQNFVGNQYASSIQSSDFGVNFLIPLDDYQKSIRSVKYAGMTISLTFLIFFLVELLNRRKIHPLQYALVGLGLCLFYILLVSLTEHMLFNTAFFVAATSIITMIVLYSMSIFNKKKHVIILMFSLICVYLFLFTTLQLQDYALLLGSIGLFITLSITMYFTRKIDWYGS